jgi:N-lysine methyltransferase SETD6
LTSCISFNHTLENHVHLEVILTPPFDHSVLINELQSDYNVCPECGSLQECPHDRDPEDPANETKPISMTGAQDENHDLYYEMVSNAGIPPHSEIFNTYGEDLTNAQLLMQYGFVLDINENDHLCWTMDEILQIISPGESAEKVWRHVAAVLPRISEDHPLYDTSQLTYYEPSTVERLCLNDEGMVSHQLWTVLFVLALGPNFILATEVETLGYLPLVLDLLLKLDNSPGDDEIHVGQDDDDESFIRSPNNGVPRQILLEIARQVVMLCRSKMESSGRPGYAALELSDVIEVGRNPQLEAPHFPDVVLSPPGDPG